MNSARPETIFILILLFFVFSLATSLVICLSSEPNPYYIEPIKQGNYYGIIDLEKPRSNGDIEVWRGLGICEDQYLTSCKYENLRLLYILKKA